MIGFYNIHTSLFIKWNISHEDETCLQSNISCFFSMNSDDLLQKNRLLEEWTYQKSQERVDRKIADE